jgi:tripartite-type tricarboxylate transporter receptor subunit TctC
MEPNYGRRLLAWLSSVPSVSCRLRAWGRLRAAPSTFNETTNRSRAALPAMRWLVRVSLALFGVAGGVMAAPFPDHPIRLVVPFPAGGGADTLARIVMPRVGQELGVPIVIDNRPAAGGNVGAELVAHAAPDGYTLLYGTNGTHAINAALYSNLRFDPVRDFAPISRMTTITALLVVNPDFPANSVAELIQFAKSHPGEVNFASAGNGTTSHLAGELFGTMAGIDIVHVPYRGGALAMKDVVGGQVQMMIDVMPNAYPQARSGKVRGLACTTARRSPAAPEYPTIAESGLPGYDVSAWDAVFAPAGTPPDIVDLLNAAIHRALEDPDVVRALLAHGAQPIPSTPGELARYAAAESRKWARIVMQSGAKID